jgi:hypothetical protein
MLNCNQRVFTISIVLVISILSLISSGICFADDQIDCGDVLTEGYYEFDENLICDDTKPAITVKGKVKLNLKGFTVTNTYYDFENEEGSIGIYVDGDQNTIYNGKISDCTGPGMSVNGNNNTIEFLKFVNNGTIVFVKEDGTVVEDYQRGCEIKGEGNLFRYNFSYGNGDDALRIRNGKNEAEFNILVGTISGECIDMDKGEARKNFCFDNDRGIRARNANVVVQNIVISSNKDGIWVEGNENKITANVVKHNGLNPGEENGEENKTAGIRVELQDEDQNNTIKLNLATGNKQLDLYDMNENCRGNTWRWNTGYGEPGCTKAPWWR